jgi:hypothetical protein
LDNKPEVTTYFINDENMKTCPHIDIKIGNRNLKGVIDMGSEISLITDVGVKIAKHCACNRVWQ